MRALIARKTRVSMTDTTLVTWEEHVLPAGSPLTEGAKRPSRQSYLYPNGSEVVIKGLDRPGRLMSSDYDLIVVPEATELLLSDWEMLTTRLRNGVMPYQQIIADVNPDAPTHWLHQRCDGGTATVFYSVHEDNPVLYDAELGEWTPRGAAYLAKLDQLSGVRRERLRYGKRVGVEGAVYPWDHRIHLIDRFEVPESWVRFRSIDFGFTEPFVCQWWALDEDRRMYLYRELFATGQRVAVLAQRILALSQGEKFAYTVADHDAENRAELAAAGIPTVAADKRIEVGVQKVQGRLEVAGDGLPRLFVMRDALVAQDTALLERRAPTSTAEEMPAYVWPAGQDGKPRKEIPVQVDDHGLDALRYAVMSVERSLEGRLVA